MVLMLKQGLALVAFTSSIGRVRAFWRLECEGSTGLARLDPLMSPGGIGDHVHSIKGGSGKSHGRHTYVLGKLLIQ